MASLLDRLVNYNAYCHFCSLLCIADRSQDANQSIIAVPVTTGSVLDFIKKLYEIQGDIECKVYIYYIQEVSKFIALYLEINGEQYFNLELLTTNNSHSNPFGRLEVDIIYLNMRLKYCEEQQIDTMWKDESIKTLLDGMYIVKLPVNGQQVEHLVYKPNLTRVILINIGDPLILNREHVHSFVHAHLQVKEGYYISSTTQDTTKFNAYCGPMMTIATDKGYDY